MIRRTLATLLVAYALPATAQDAQPHSGRAYLIACGEEGCFLNAAGLDLFAPADGSEPLALLAELPMMSAVDIEGEITNIGDSTADIALSSVSTVPDDMFEGNLQFLQGDWRPDGEETPFYISVQGMDWAEYQMDEEQGRFDMTARLTCANGVEPGGMAISLYPQGSPDAIACWNLEYIDETTLELRDVMGDQGLVSFTRMTGQ